MILIADQSVGILVIWQRKAIDDLAEHHGNLPGSGIVDIDAVVGVDTFGLQITGRSIFVASANRFADCRHR